VAITAERLMVEVGGDTSGAEKALGDLGKEGGKVPGWATAAKGALVGLFAVGATTAFLKSSVDAASDLSENLSKVGVVFGAQAAQIVAGSATSAKAMGLSKSAYLDANGTLGNLLVSLKIAPDAAAGMSQSMVALAGDLASFNNVPVEDALAAITSGLTGETEPLKKFGVNMNDATLKAQALSMGLISSTKDALDPQTKALAANALILAQTGTAQGDFARTSGGLANQQRILSASFEDVKTRVGSFFLPAVTAVTTFLGANLGPAVETVIGGITAMAAAFQAGGDDVTSSGFAGVMERVGLAARAAADYFTANIMPAISGLASLISGTILPPLQNLVTGFQDGTGAGGFLRDLLPVLGGALGGIVSNIGPVISGLTDAATWMTENTRTIAIMAGVITTVLLPVFVNMAVKAVASGIAQVGVWVSTQVAAVSSAASQFAAHYTTVAGWVASAAAAVVSGAETVAIWLMLAADATASAVAQGLAQAKVVAGWVLSAAGAVVNGAIMVASMVVTAASVVGGWVLMGLQSMIAAAQMAAAWFIALGPIGWVIAAVVAIAALVIANWDTISAATAAAWGAITGWVSGAWDAIVGWVTAGVNNVKAFISAGFALVVTIITAYVNAWKAVISAVWGAIQAIVSGAIAGVQAAIGGLASIAGKVGGWFGSAKDAISDKLGAAVSFVAGIPGKIIAALGAVGSMLYNSGSSIIQGLIDGIAGMAGKVKDAVSGVLKKARDLLPFSPAKEGPFSGKGWTLYSGQAISASLAKGISDNTNQVKAAALGMMNAAQIDLGGVTGTPAVRLNGNPAKGRTTTAELGVSQADDGGPRTLTIVDTDGTLIGRMQVEAGRVQTRQVTPLDHGMASW